MDKFETNRPSRQSLIVYGGSFDPWHEGHEAVVEWLCTHSDVPVCIVPTDSPWYKEKKLRDFDQRVQKIKPILKKEFARNASISTIERDIPSIEGRAQRLIQYIQQLPDVTEIALAIGADSWKNLGQWTDIDDWFHKVHWIVLQRDQTFERSKPDWPKMRTSSDGYEIQDTGIGTLLQTSAHKILFANNPLVHASSSSLQNK